MYSFQAFQIIFKIQELMIELDQKNNNNTPVFDYFLCSFLKSSKPYSYNFADSIKPSRTTQHKKPTHPKFFLLLIFLLSHLVL
jgi:hypothetical protein